MLIANTGNDRLIDWAGEFNSYIVPFGPFGAPTIVRARRPHVVSFLYELSASDGADQTLGSDPARNGEPYGELGLVLQHDSSEVDWQDQTGGPRDPQAGNNGGTQRITRGNSSAASDGKAAANARKGESPEDVASPGNPLD